MKRQKRNGKYTPLVKFASIVASAILVLNLLPVQGIAEAYKGDLVVLKDVPYNTDADRDQEFTLRVTLYNDYTKTTVAEDITKTYETLKTDDKPLNFVNGVATVRLRHWERYDDDGNLISERASAKNLPEGLAYEVEEIASDELQGFEPTIVYGIYDGARKESDSTVITKDRLAEAKVTNNRKLTAAGIKKVWDDEADQSIRPQSLEMKLYRSDNLNEPYKTVTLPVGGEWEWTLDMLPATDYNGNRYIYTWGEPEVEGYTLTSTATSDLKPSEDAGVAGVLTTLTNTRDLGNLKVTKHFANIDQGALTSEDLKQITVSVKNAEGTEVATKNLFEFPSETDGTLSWTLENLPTGTYTVTETNAHKKYSFDTTYKVNEGETSTEPASPVIAKGEMTTVDVTNTYKPHKPGFDKKIKDINDTTGTTSDWQDSADYDIGDAVPYKLTATLAQDVTTYKKYHVTFSDKMEDSLTYNKDAQITVTGADGETIDPSTYTVDKVAENDHDFAYKISWTGEEGGFLADTNLNGAKVEVLFTANLNENAKLGKEGNVNACKLSYSNNPASEDDKDEGELPWDYVIAFTYKLDVSKVDPEAKAIEGAEFKLEKKLVDGTTKEVALSTAGNVFTGVGLDDGAYVLTETKAPTGYKAIDPIEFEVTADHNATWDYTSDATKDPAFDNDGTAGSKRLETLTALTGNTKTGILELKADDKLAGLAGDVVNEVQGTTAQLSVTKQVLGDDYKGDEEFNFQLEKATDLRKIYGNLAPDTDVLPEETTAKAKAGETATFGEITYTEDGTYYYTISEVEPETKTDGMVYMTQPNYVIVTVKDGVAEVKYGPSLDTSSYTAETITEAYQKLADAIADGSAYDQMKDNKLTVTNYYAAPIDGSITVRKVVVSTRSEDRTKNYGFRVTLYSDTAHTKVAEDVNGTYGDMTFVNGVATFTLTGGEAKTAKSLPFNDDDAISYRVTETDAGGLTPNIVGSKAANGLSANEVCTNTYTAPRTSSTTGRTTTTVPRTSDDTNWIPVAALAVAGIGIVAFALIRRRKQQ